MYNIELFLILTAFCCHSLKDITLKFMSTIHVQRREFLLIQVKHCLGYIWPSGMYPWELVCSVLRSQGLSVLFSFLEAPTLPRLDTTPYA